MPGPFRLRVPRDEMQPLGIVRQIHVDDELRRISAVQPRTDIERAAMDVLLDRRSALRAGADLTNAPYPGGGGR